MGDKGAKCSFGIGQDNRIRRQGLGKVDQPKKSQLTEKKGRCG